MTQFGQLRAQLITFFKEEDFSLPELEISTMFIYALKGPEILQRTVIDSINQIVHNYLSTKESN